MEKIKKISLVAVFCLIIFGFGIAMWILPDGTLSESERRQLKQLPEFSLQALFDGDNDGNILKNKKNYFNDLESYFLDQFPLRDAFRTLNSISNSFIFNVSDTNGIYLYKGQIYKLEYPLDKSQLQAGIDKIQSIIAAHPEAGNFYFSIVPDKNYYAPLRDKYPSYDYEELEKIMTEGVKDAEYIDIFDCLSSEDYYNTDTHWRQEELFPVIDKLCQSMGVPYADKSEYKAETLSPFYGVYYGQSAMPVAPDTITYLTHEMFQNVKVQSAEHKSPMSVYTLKDFEGLDGYDIYLSGAEALITIENPNALTDKELIIYRDSFGSSITPLLIASYSKITMVDIRYVYSDMVNNMVNFENADVLFMYSTIVLNTAKILK
ncbi:MAG: hypothetical protein E7623_01335 [Ruminococcaceae bacterium]|nr:hypothetical protein [Oscillospiraceae bacterium]